MIVMGGCVDECILVELISFGLYWLRGWFGEGGMGVVYFGLDVVGCVVVVKVLRVYIVYDFEVRARLVREVLMLCCVCYLLVVEVIDVDVDGEQFYVVICFVPGFGLDEVVRDHGVMRFLDLLRFGCGLFGALQVIYVVYVVYCDFKLVNVLFVDGDFVVIDFGIVYVVDDVWLILIGLVMGMFGYLLFEVIDGERVSEVIDWWGWVVMLVFVVSGCLLFGCGLMDVVIDCV